MEIYSEDIEFLKELYSQNELDLYFFHEKYRLSPAQLSRTINKFLETGLIDLKENKVILNDVGRKWIISHRKKLFLDASRRYWKKVPEDMTQDVICINELYKPNRKEIDVELFKIFEDGE